MQLYNYLFTRSFKGSKKYSILSMIYITQQIAAKQSQYAPLPVISALNVFTIITKSNHKDQFNI